MPEKDPVRGFLESYWELRKEHERLERKIEELESQCQSVTAKLNAVPGGGGSRSNDTWDALVEARGRAGQQLAETLYREAEIEQFINSLSEPVHRQLLKHRYLELMDWETIADILHYTVRHTLRKHGDALEESRQIWNRETEDTP